MSRSRIFVNFAFYLRHWLLWLHQFFAVHLLTLSFVHHVHHTNRYIPCHVMYMHNLQHIKMHGYMYRFW